MQIFTVFNWNTNQKFSYQTNIPNVNTNKSNLNLQFKKCSNDTKIDAINCIDLCLLCKTIRKNYLLCVDWKWRNTLEQKETKTNCCFFLSRTDSDSVHLTSERKSSRCKFFIGLIRLFARFVFVQSSNWKLMVYWKQNRRFQFESDSM